MKLPPGVSLPARIAALPREERGYPVPFFAFITPEGKPDLRVSDVKKSRLCHEKQLCWVCGQELLSQVCFIGGPRSYASGHYSDGPMHRDCAEFSLQVCPYLALPNAQRRDKNLPKNAMHGTGAVDEKPEAFVLVIVKKGDWTYDHSHHIFTRGTVRTARVWRDCQDQGTLDLKISRTPSE